MAVDTYIITTEDFQRRADLSNNIRTDKIQAHIGPVQEISGRKVLCEDLYNEVLSVIANDITDNTPVNDLLPHLKDFLVYKTYREYLVTAGITMTPMGARVQVDATSDAATDKQLAEIQRQAGNRANYYQDRLINFLEINISDYPQWAASICNCSPNRRTVKNNTFSVIGSASRKVNIEWT